MTRIEKVFQKYPMFEDIVSINKMVRDTCPGDFLLGEPVSHAFVSTRNLIAICHVPNCKECWNQEAANDQA